MLTKKCGFSVPNRHIPPGRGTLCLPRRNYANLALYPGIRTMKNGLPIAAIALALMLLPPCAARAASDDSCLRDYERAAHDYWLIVSDIMRFKTMFDNYDQLCTRHYPDEIAALQDSADLMRRQVRRDVADAEKVVQTVFDERLPQVVAPECRDDKIARDRVRKNFTVAMKAQSKTVGARLEKSALTVANPEQSLKLCRELKKIEPVVVKKLGPDMAHPLFEMSKANSTFMTKDAKHRKAAFATYGDILGKLEKMQD